MHLCLSASRNRPLQHALIDTSISNEKSREVFVLSPRQSGNEKSRSRTALICAVGCKNMAKRTRNHYYGNGTNSRLDVDKVAAHFKLGQRQAEGIFPESFRSGYLSSSPALVSATKECACFLTFSVPLYQPLTTYSCLP